ncbi:aldose epimerase family protein [Aquibacillus salsiterrae]|uniref:Aldose 1-epimerase n=1 Tax=Aquibacillus salsiterrae TaxID=2950439 RepID=A0A9X3WE01_9BACI|nr:aldose epimerase family protein [Aquibacillus salsiterrae]MDC3418112.1 galactose mutarotase [Aquibacillus salsiterrae]
MQVKTEAIKVSDQQWQEFTLSNDLGMEVSILNYGGIITKILAPDRHKSFENVVVSYKNYEDYIANPNFFGALIGRVAGRIQDASFELDGHTYTLLANDNDNHLHGGAKGFHNAIWDAEAFEGTDEVGVKLTHQSPDGEGGYPGNITMEVTYTLNNKNQLSISYQGTTDKKTALTATNHSYFNLSGDLKDTMLKHNVTIDSSKFVELDEELIPTGEQLDVDGTVYDFRNGRTIEDGTTSDFKQNLVAGNGYDHYFLFDNTKEEKIVVKESDSGRKLTVTTDQPGFVMYTSNMMAETLSLREGKSRKYLGLCLETQASPASLHHEGFPSVVLEKGERYTAKTTFEFGLV